MNTPRTKKRFNRSLDPSKIENGTWIGALVDPEYQAALGKIASSFEHLEETMPAVLAVLMGTTDTIAAGYVYRAIRNPAIRSSLMWHLLETAPHNKNMPEWFDDVLAEYGSVRSRRNEYVHGLWSHKEEDDTTFLARFPEHGWFFDASKREPLSKLQDLERDISALSRKVRLEVWQHVAALQKQQQAQALIDAQRQAERERRRAAKAPRPPPESSGG
jgi:hypothetical protein